MRIGRRFWANIVYVILGIILSGLSLVGTLDSFWGGMGSALIAIGIIRMVHTLCYAKDEAYREEKTIEATDERHQFLRNKAWAWAGYLFIIICALSTIGFKLLNQDLLCMASGGAVCLMLVLFWVSFFILKKKY